MLIGDDHASEQGDGRLVMVASSKATPSHGMKTSFTDEKLAPGWGPPEIT